MVGDSRSRPAWANTTKSTTTAPTSISVRASFRKQPGHVGGVHEETLAPAACLEPVFVETLRHQLTTWARPSRLLRQGRHEAYVPDQDLDISVEHFRLTRWTDFHLLRNHEWAPIINIEKLYVCARDQFGVGGMSTNTLQLVSRPRRGPREVRQRRQVGLCSRCRPPFPRLCQAPRQG